MGWPLSKQVQSAEVTMLVDLAHVQVTLDQILNMQVGDVIPLDIPEFVTASVDGVPVMECRYGISNGQLRSAHGKNAWFRKQRMNSRLNAAIFQIGPLRTISEETERVRKATNAASQSPNRKLPQLPLPDVCSRLRFSSNSPVRKRCRFTTTST